jgi:hypothetical protein
VASGTTGPACCCGKPLPEGNLARDYRVPDLVARLSAEDLAQRTLFRSQRVMSVTRVGNFIQVILPLPVEHAEWERVMKAGRQGGDTWADVRFAGRIATAAQPWPQILGGWARP